METIIRLTAVCVVSAVLAVFVKKSSPEMGLVLTLSVCVVVLLALMVPIREIVELLNQMMVWSGMSEDIFAPLLKTLGIALICRVGGDLCRDAGQTAMASLVEMGGSFGAILVSIPLLRAVWEMLQSMI
jgi:stage III sporulation protein AD